MAGYWPSYLFRFYRPRRSNNMQQGVQTDATCYIQQFCIRLHGAYSIDQPIQRLDYPPKSAI